MVSYVLCLTEGVLIQNVNSVYSEKLQMSVKAGTVKKFKRLYLSRLAVHSDTTTTIDLLHSSINVLNQVGILYPVHFFYPVPQGVFIAFIQDHKGGVLFSKTIREVISSIQY